jgi:hypothetical protein
MAVLQLSVVLLNLVVPQGASIYLTAVFIYSAVRQLYLGIIPWVSFPCMMTVPAGSTHGTR